MKLLVFAGTTEGRLLAQAAHDKGIDVTVSVATEYGRDILSYLDMDRDGIKILQGRMDADEIKKTAAGFDAVADATHPYAVAVTANIKKACQECCVKYYRLLREETFSEGQNKKIRFFNTLSELSQALCNTSGNIFISTGSKELDCFKVIPDYQDRLWVRVIPSQESITKCIEAGIKLSQVIAMQGPFSQRLNEALFEMSRAKILVTKSSGSQGGYDEKINAAFKCSMDVYCVRRPEESGVNIYTSQDNLIADLLQIYGT